MENKMSIIEYLMKKRCRNILMYSDNEKKHEMSIKFYLTKEEYENFSKNALGKHNHGYLLNEYREKIKLSNAEYYILKNIDKKYQWIVRDKNNNLHAYTNKPFKDINIFVAHGDFIGLKEFNHLFKFIKWEDKKQTNIQELLDNCEVEDE